MIAPLRTVRTRMTIRDRIADAARGTVRAASLTFPHARLLLSATRLARPRGRTGTFAARAAARSVSLFSLALRQHWPRRANTEQGDDPLSVNVLQFPRDVFWCARTLSPILAPGCRQRW
ncbi:hypothetical protein WOLCODRAFT_138257 [Wolfiporia cocos MD-104 SS10]|uniref:Uncharacterized protein n=1 Tax=Wolfiporia cocos (strain MD-104) TaxID=742152 RepID=A0A2H3K472_WOLCO|nr:hypothetical protein WOLCODRAFT_138257 [Wolfiporia cocos MD-104 SS10]